MRVVAAFLLVLALTRSAAADQATAVYNHACSWCHGMDGRGDGPAAFSINKYRSPRPRDFTRGRFKFRSTPSGQLPTDDDLLRTVERGIPRYMPSFKGLTAGERRQAVEALKRFYTGFESARPTPVTIPEAPVVDADAVARGRQVYEDAGCAACHGDRGHGDGSSAAALRDDVGLPIQPADFRFPRLFKGGSSPEDLYRTLVTGLDGTPMPSYASAIDDPNALWDLIAYVRSLKRR